MSLVSEDRTKAGSDDTPLFASDPFVAPAGWRDLNLVLDVLLADEAGSLAPFRHIPEDAVILATVQLALSRSAEPRPGKVSRSQFDAIVDAVASGATPREVGAEFGISAERVRQFVRARRGDA